MFVAIIDALGWVMTLFYQITESYVGCLLLFTVLVKLLFLPLSVWQQKNSIKMVAIQPEVNCIRAQYINDSAKAGEEQMALYKRVGYRPLAGLIPILIQIPLILLVIHVVYNPLGYLLQIEPQVIDELHSALAAAQGADKLGIAWQLMAIPMIERGVLGAPQAVLSALEGFPRYFLGEDLLKVPSFGGGALIFAALAILSTVLLCYVQNRANVLQREQTGFNRWGTSVLMIALSIYLAFALPGAVLVYWSAGNLLSIVILFLLNLVINPQKSIDYQALEESRGLLQEAMKSKKTPQQVKQEVERSKRDYQRFLKTENKELVFYSDSSGYYRYYRALIEEVLRRTDDIVVHYLTDDPDDQVLAMESDRFKPYYVDTNRMIVLFMKLECTMMVTTVPDLGNYHLKRSIVKPDVEYIYISHGMGSVNYGLRKGSFDHFDTLLCMGQHMIREVREMEQMYGLPEKKLIPFGYPLLDALIEEVAASPAVRNDLPQVIIAPSYQEDNILESCFSEMVQALLEAGFRVVMRPHPYWVKHNPGDAERIAREYSEQNFVLDMNFADASQVFGSDVLITDWSTVAMDFSFSTLRPSIFINTKTKVRNPDYQKYKNRPIDFTLRTQIGVELEKQEVGSAIVSTVNELIEKKMAYREQIRKIRHETIFNIGHSAEIGAEYLLSRLKREEVSSRQPEKQILDEKEAEQ